MNQVEALEQAILARAEQLARQYRERANRARSAILREAALRRHAREQREEAAAKAQGERAFRQQVQASELKMQSQLDQMRWNLVQAVERQLADRMRRFTEDESTYLAFLEKLIVSSAQEIQRNELEILANARDAKPLAARWEAVTAAATGCTLRLGDEPIATLAGLIVRSADGRIRVDHTFEGRLARLRPRIAQAITERLLPSGLDTSSLFVG